MIPPFNFCLLVLVATASVTVVPVANAAQLVIINHFSKDVQLTSPQSRTISAGTTSDVISGLGGNDANFDELINEGTNIEISEPMNYKTDFPGGTQLYAIIVVNENGDVSMHDTNDLQVDISNTLLEKCDDDASKSNLDSTITKCLSTELYGGGLAESFIQKPFQSLWQSLHYWRLCNSIEPGKPLRSIQSNRTLRVGYDDNNNDDDKNYQIDILRETPLVATVRSFLSVEQCGDLLTNHAHFDQLVAARVGTGGGKTSTSTSRETLTKNMFVNWDIDTILSRMAAGFFDLVSELTETKVPYEAQEPINFLHYLKGYEYKPHTDGSGDKNNPKLLGKRIATTLIYCQTAVEGGGTVFPRGNEENPPLRFQPSPGDLLMFEYAPDWALQEHSACPVINSRKSTFTQWHRLGVTPEQPWDNYEDWGKFGNPMINTRWKGPRYGSSSSGAVAEDEEAEEL